jgi:hypothetical protein
MSTYQRECNCAHPYPLCACGEGLHGKALRVRSRRLSSLAAWPARVTDESARAVLAEFGKPDLASGPAPGPSVVTPPEWWPEGLSFALFADAPPLKPDGGCGCGRA